MRVDEMIFFLQEMQNLVEKIKQHDPDKYAGYYYDEHDILQMFINDQIEKEGEDNE